MRGRLPDTEQEHAWRFMLLAVGSRTRPQLEERLCHFLQGPLDWPYVLREAQAQGIVPLLDEAIVSHHLEDLVPPPCRLQFGKTRSWVFCRNLLLLSELKRVLGHLSTLGIGAIPIKGPVLTETLYGDLSLRPASDLDILVKPGALPVCRQALASLGYKSLNRYEEGHPFHDPPYYLTGSPRLVIELHWALSDEALVPLDSKAIWERVGYASVDGVRILTLSPEDNLIYLAHHLSKHTDRPLGRLCDIAGLLEKQKDSLNWDYIGRALPSTGTGHFLYVSLARAHRLLGAAVPPHILESITPGAFRRFMLDLVANDGVFLGLGGGALRAERLGLSYCLMHSGVRRVWQSYCQRLLSSGQAPGWPALLWQRIKRVARSGLAFLAALGGPRSLPGLGARDRGEG